MPLPFPKLPSLVQFEVLKQLEFQEIFLMSLCSERLKKLIERLNMKPEKLKYALGPDGVLVFVENDDAHHYVARMRCALEVFIEEEPPMKGTKLFGGYQVICRCIPGAKNFSNELTYSIPEENTIIKSLSCHMRGLFRYETRFEIHAYETSILSRLDAIENVKDICFLSNYLDTSVLESVLTAYPSLDSLQIDSRLSGPPLRYDSKLWEIKGLAVSQSGGRTSEIMRNFRGHYLLFFDAIWNMKDWKEMIGKWKRHEGYHELKSMRAQAPDGANTIPWLYAVLQEFDLMEWDGLRRPKNYVFDPKIINIQVEEEIDCSEWRDIQQDGRGKWASVVLEDKSIQFVVWD